ncbi:MAG: DUF4468 domain-containing protein [Reichenbachiella sp.]
MKKPTITTSLLLILLTFFMSTAFSQKLELVDGKYIYQDIYNTEVNKDDSYILIRRWFAESYNSSEEVLEVEDRENGMFIGRGRSAVKALNRMGNSFTKDIAYTIKVEIKDLRFRLTFSNVEYIDAPSQYTNYQNIYVSAETLLSQENLSSRKNGQRIFSTTLKKGAEAEFLRIGRDIMLYLEKEHLVDDW